MNPDAILTADWHIRADTPTSRTDDFTAAMWRKVQFINDLANEHNIPILIAGDLGHLLHCHAKKMSTGRLRSGRVQIADQAFSLVRQISQRRRRRAGHRREQV